MGKFNFGRTRTNIVLDIPENREMEVINRARVGQIEILRSNRFIITVNGIDIPENQFTGYNLVFRDTVFKLTVSFYDTVEHWFNPTDMNSIESFSIQYLDPVGIVISTLNIMVVEPLTFERHGSYSDLDILKNFLSFKVNVMQY